MAEFCRQCAQELDFEPNFVGLVSEDDVMEGFGALVLCEGCGPTIVDHTGRCISPDCLRQHHKIMIVKG
jgi:hypothetical protein